MKDPYEMQNLVYEWVDFSKSGQIWAKIGSNLRKFWKKSVISFQIWPKIGPIGIWMGYFSLKNWYLYGSTFKFVAAHHPYQNQTWVPPECRHRPILNNGRERNICHSGMKILRVPRISAFCVCLRRCYFFTLKTRVFIAKRTKNRNVGPTKLRKTNIKIGKYCPGLK